MNKLDIIWVMFKVYLNNPNYYVKQQDVLNDLFGRKDDLTNFMCTLGIQDYTKEITFGQLLTKLNIL